MCLLRIFGSFLRLALLYNVNPLPESQEMLQKSGAIRSKSAEALLRGCVLTQCSTSRQNQMHFIPLIILFSATECSHLPKGNPLNTTKERRKQPRAHSRSGQRSSRSSDMTSIMAQRHLPHPHTATSALRSFHH